MNVPLLLCEHTDESIQMLLLDLAADALAIILEKAKNNGFIKGVLTV